MNLEKLMTWIVGVVIAFSAAGKIDVLQTWIWRAQAKAVYASRTSTWGSPRFFCQHRKLDLQKKLAKPSDKSLCLRLWLLDTTMF